MQQTTQVHRPSLSGAERPRSTTEAARSDASWPSLWLTCLLRGAVLVAIGIVAIVFPFTTLFAATLVLSAAAFVDGLYSIWTAATGGATGAWTALARGVVGILIGALFLVMPLLATFSYSVAALMLISVWAALTGLGEIITAIRFRRRLKAEWILGLWGLLLLVFGLIIPVVLIINPASFVGLGWALGIYALFTGITLISTGLSLRFFTKSARE